MDNNKDKLEDFFKRAFNHEEGLSESDDWNTPSPMVWSNIEAELQNDQKREKPILWFYQGFAAAASVLLLLSAFLLYRSNQKMQDLVDRVTEDRKNNIELRTPAQPNQNLSNETVLPTQPKSYSLQSVDAKALDSISLKAEQAYSESGILRKNPFHLEEIQSIVRPVVKSKTNTGFLIPLLTKPEMGPINSMTPTTSDEELEHLNIIPNSDQRSVWYLSALFGPIWENVRTANTPPPRFESFAKDRVEDRAITGGILLGFRINEQWALETGAFYTQANIDVQHDRQIPLVFLQEQLTPDGAYESSISLRGSSTEGTFETEVQLTRPSDSPIPQNSSIRVNLNLDHQLSFLDIPFYIKRNWQVNRFGFNLKAGILNRINIQQKLDLERFEIDDPRFIVRSDVDNHPGKAENTRSYSSFLAMGTGLSYQISNKWQLEAASVWNRGLSPLVRFNRREIHKDNFMVNVGMTFQL